MFARLRTAATIAAAIAIVAAGATARPAAAATSDHCTYVGANQPQGQIATTWYRLGGAPGPLGCPSAPERNGSQLFQHGTISHPSATPETTLVSYLRGGQLHVAITSLGRAHDRYQIAAEPSDGTDSHLWSVAGGSSASFVATLPERGGPFRVKLFACEAHTSVFASAAFVCDRSEGATTVSAPLELTMDPVSPHAAPTGAVALRH